MHPTVHTWSLALGATLGVTLLWCVVALIRAQGAAWRAQGPGLKFAWAGFVFLGAIFLMRPHGDTFTALDHSGYRLMARAFQSGRDFHETDAVLLEAPADLRNDFLLLRGMKMRNTRDRSFTVTSLATGETEPFYLPILPLSAAAFDLAVPGDALDYLVPAVGLVFLAAWLFAGTAGGAGWGLLLAAALWTLTPLPLWLFRGFHAEAIAAALAGFGALLWLRTPGGRAPSPAAALALGLSVSFHPSMMAAALPLLVLLLLRDGMTWKRRLAHGVGFAAGLLPLHAVMSEICTPYGALTVSAFRHALEANGTLRLTLVFAVAGAVLVAAGLAVWPRLQPRLMRTPLVTWPRVTDLVVILLAAGVVAATLQWAPQRSLIRTGARDFATGLVSPLLALTLFLLLRDPAGRRPRWLLAVMLLTLPYHLYLKGAEPMGLWSERRLLLPTLLYGIALSQCPPAGFAVRAKMPRADRIGMGALVFVGVALLTLVNAVRWPAAYLARVDEGAWTWTREVAQKIHQRLTVFDYYPFSCPFAVENRARVLGLGPDRWRHWPRILDWLRTRADDETVLLATAYAPTGIEDGLRLERIATYTNSFTRVTSKGVRAEWRTQDIQLHLLRLVPLKPDDRRPATAKIFDGGNLALRGPWGRAGFGFDMPDGSRLPAQWSRAGSAVVGPIPRPGHGVRISLLASNGRPLPSTERVFRIRPPWDTSRPAEFRVVSEPKSASVILAGPPAPSAAVTGLYVFETDTPYDPALEGLRGYPSDLVALVHSIAIEEIDPERLPLDLMP